MVTEEAYATLAAENATLRHDLAVVREELAGALQRIGELEAKKTPPARFVKANTPTGTKRERKRRAAEHIQARRREGPSVVVAYPLTTCPDCGGRRGGVHVGRRRQVAAGGRSAAACRRRGDGVSPSDGVVQRRLSVGVAALVAHLRTSLRLPIRRIQTYRADLHGLRVSVGEIVDVLRRVGE